MLFQSIMRGAVVRSNPHWPFSKINKLPYGIAVDAFVNQCKTFPEIRGVFLRHGLTSGDWIPGISDIDLTVVTDSHRDGDTALRFLERFWSMHSRLKRVFPMLGETLVLESDLLDVWSRFSISGYEMNRWKRLYGDVNAESRYVASPARVSLDAFNYALTYYKLFLSGKVFGARSDPAVSALGSARLISKIARYANYGVEELPQLCAHELSRLPRSRMNERAVSALRSGIPQVEEILSGIASRKANSAATNEPMPLEESDLPFDRFPRLSRSVLSVISGYDIHVVVLRDNLSSATSTEGFDALRSIFGSLGPDPLILEAAVLRYMIRVSSPFLNRGLRAYGRLIFGEDPLVGVVPPEADFIHQRVLEEAASVVRFPSGPDLFRSSFGAWLAGDQPAEFLRRALFIRLLIERGEIEQQWGCAIAETKRRSAADYQTLAALQSKPLNGSAVKSRAAAFQFFRQIAREIANAVRTFTPPSSLYPY